jgi:hypothetical protein
VTLIDLTDMVSEVFRTSTTLVLFNVDGALSCWSLVSQFMLASTSWFSTARPTTIILVSSALMFEYLLGPISFAPVVLSFL